MNPTVRLYALCAALLLPMFVSAAKMPAVADAETEADTTIVVDRVQVTAIKQGRVLRQEPLAATIVGQREVERRGITTLKQLSARTPNLHIPDYGSRMTSSVYVRGLGARIDQPVIGMNVDNVPLMNKNLFDTEMADIERIEVLRGPQSTLYGRNTMGGVVNIYTLSPLTYEGARLTAEYASGDTWRIKASVYQRLTEELGSAISGFYTSQGGFFENLATGEKCDWERMGGGRWKLQWQGRGGLRIDNTFTASLLDQGGYPYAYVGKELTGDNGATTIRPGEIRYNDPAGYERTAISDGLTIRLDRERYTFSSITSYQFIDDCMTLDQDFLPESYFTLEQAIAEHSVTEDIVFSSRNRGRYNWLVGAFGFYRHNRMDAPVNFKQKGVDELIFKNANSMFEGTNIRYEKLSDELALHSSFENPSFGAALYHESRLRLGRWLLTAGLRMDFEHTALTYRSKVDMEYMLHQGDYTDNQTVAIDDRRTIKKEFVELLPKLTATYSFDAGRNIYISVAKGYKAGGFNTQMFSDILQERLKWQMVGTVPPERDLMSYRPEKSWNMELGGHFSCLDGMVRGDMALFWIECRDQQLTRFPHGQSTGRMMTNAGKTRSRGVEISLMALPRHNVELTANYGFTDARFRHYDDGHEDHAGRRLPYAPRHTLSVSGTWSIPTGIEWLGDVVLAADMHSAGDICWNEANTLRQDFYALVGASVRIEHPHYSLTLWGRNLTDAQYDVFYFKSMGNEFVQRGRPRTFGITLSLNILEP